MEISLNLLPPRLIEEQAQRRRRQRWIAGGAAAVVPIVLLYVGLSVQVAVLQGQLRALDREVAPLARVVTKVQAVQAQRDAMRARLAALSTLSAAAPHWSVVLKDLTDLVPGDVWFTSLAFSGNSVAISGNALTEASVSVFAARLTQNHLLASASLQFIHAEGNGPQRFLSFQITGPLGAAKPAP